MIHKATYIEKDGEYFIEGFKTEEPIRTQPEYNVWLTTKECWKVNDGSELNEIACYLYITTIEKQQNISLNKAFEQGINLPKEISDRIEIELIPVNYNYQLGKQMYLKCAIINPVKADISSKDGFNVPVSDLDKQLNEFANWCLVNYIKFNDSNQICELVKRYLDKRK